MSVLVGRRTWQPEFSSLEPDQAKNLSHSQPLHKESNDG